MDAHLLLSGQGHPVAVGLMAVHCFLQVDRSTLWKGNKWQRRKKRETGAAGAAGLNGRRPGGRRWEVGGLTWKQLTIKESARAKRHSRGEIEASHAQTWRDSDGHHDDCWIHWRNFFKQLTNVQGGPAEMWRMWWLGSVDKRRCCHGSVDCLADDNRKQTTHRTAQPTGSVALKRRPEPRRHVEPAAKQVSLVRPSQKPQKTNSSASSRQMAAHVLDTKRKKPSAQRHRQQQSNNFAGQQIRLCTQHKATEMSDEKDVRPRGWGDWV